VVVKYAVSKMRAKHPCLSWLFFDVLGKLDATFSLFEFGKWEYIF